jgi:hypothetical protein
LLGRTPAIGTCAHSACLLDACSGAHTGFEWRVFDLRAKALLAWTAGVTASNTYVDADGDVRALAIAENAYLDVRFISAGAYEPSGSNAYTSANPLAIGLPSMVVI